MRQLNSVFDLKLNDKILDNKTGLTGVVVSIRETAYEWVDAFVLWDNKETEEILQIGNPNLYLIE